MSNRLKKDSKWSFLEIDKFEIDEIKKEIIEYKNEWLADQSRQNTYLTHKDTETITLISSDYTWVPGKQINKVVNNLLKSDEANNEINKIYQSLEKRYEGQIVRSEIVKLKSQTKIRKHVDGGAMLHYSRRCHIPIITNSLVYFTVNDNKINMAESQGYEINNTLPHSVENNSLHDRVHIIIDILPDSMLHYDKTGE